MTEQSILTFPGGQKQISQLKQCLQIFLKNNCRSRLDHGFRFESLFTFQLLCTTFDFWKILYFQQIMRLLSLKIPDVLVHKISTFCEEKFWFINFEFYWTWRKYMWPKRVLQLTLISSEKKEGNNKIIYSSNKTKFSIIKQFQNDIKNLFIFSMCSGWKTEEIIFSPNTMVLLWEWWCTEKVTQEIKFSELNKKLNTKNFKFQYQKMIFICAEVKFWKQWFSDYDIAREYVFIAYCLKETKMSASIWYVSIYSKQIITKKRKYIKIKNQTKTKKSNKKKK